MRSAPRLLPLSLPEFVARVAAHSGGVCGLVSDVEDLPAFARSLASEFEFVAERPAALIAVTEGAEAVLAALAAIVDATAILFGFSTLSPEAWTRIDELRNRFDRPAGLVLLMASHDLENLQEHAPNLSSWLGGRVWRWSDEVPDLSDTEIQRRLSALREHFKQSDDDVLTSARDGTLPPDPEYAEWLILLGQGNLLV